MSLRSPLAYLIGGALLYYAFLRWRGTITGMPWAPMNVQVGPRSAAA